MILDLAIICAGWADQLAANHGVLNDVAIG